LASQSQISEGALFASATFQAFELIIASTSITGLQLIVDLFSNPNCEGARAVPITSAKYFMFIIGYSHSKIPLVFRKDFTIFCEGVKDNGNAVSQQLFGLNETGFVGLDGQIGCVGYNGLVSRINHINHIGFFSHKRLTGIAGFVGVISCISIIGLINLAALLNHWLIGLIGVIGFGLISLVGLSGFGLVGLSGINCLIGFIGLIGLVSFCLNGLFGKGIIVNSLHFEIEMKQSQHDLFWRESWLWCVGRVFSSLTGLNSAFKNALQNAKQVFFDRIPKMTKYCVMTECENIHSWISLSGDLVFSHQQGIYGFKFPKRFWRSLPEISFLLSFFS
jgi:hypothetical protein